MILCLGVDISQHFFDVALIDKNGKRRHKRFTNTKEGFAALLAWLRAQGVQKVHACLEATGTYGEALALYLHEAGHTVSVLNPAMTHNYAKSQLHAPRPTKSMPS